MLSSASFKSSPFSSGHSAPFDLLFGPQHLEERLATSRGRELVFRLGPGSCFPSGSKEDIQTLVDVVADKCLGEDEEEDMVLLDLCCGSGLFGLAMADRVKNVIGNAAKIIKSGFPQILFPTITGVDLSGAAVDDAESNAEASGVENAEFLHEEKLENALEARQK